MWPGILRGLSFAVVAFGFVVIGVLAVAWQQLWAQRRVRRGR
jgi:hypothetical protein